MSTLAGPDLIRPLRLLNYGIFCPGDAGPHAISDDQFLPKAGREV